MNLSMNALGSRVSAGWTTPILLNSMIHRVATIAMSGAWFPAIQVTKRSCPSFHGTMTFSTVMPGFTASNSFLSCCQNVLYRASYSIQTARTDAAPPPRAGSARRPMPSAAMVASATFLCIGIHPPFCVSRPRLVLAGYRGRRTTYPSSERLTESGGKFCGPAARFLLAASGPERLGRSGTAPVRSPATFPGTPCRSSPRAGRGAQAKRPGQACWPDGVPRSSGSGPG